MIDPSDSPRSVADPSVPRIALAGAQADRRSLIAQLPSIAALLEGADHVVSAASPSFREMVGGRDPVGRRVAEVLSDAGSADLSDRLDEIYRTGEAVRAAPRIAGVSGSKQAAAPELVYQPIRGPGGSTEAIVVQVADSTERSVLEREREFLAEVSELLASSIEYEKTLTAVTQLAVRAMADWCAIDEITPDGKIRRISVAHPDPRMVALAHEVARRYPPDPDAPHGVGNVIRTREVEFVSEIPDELLVQVARDAEHLRIVRALGLTSYIAVPLVARDHVLGVLTFVTSGAGRRLGPGDLRLAKEIGRRAAIAIDNARLYRHSEESRLQLEEQAIELESQAEELLSSQCELELAHEEMRHTNIELERRVNQAEEAVATAKQAGDRLRLLAEAGALLASSFDYEAVLVEITRLVVPEIVDWCWFEVADRGGRLKLVAGCHGDPARQDLANRLWERAGRSEPLHRSRHVLRTGEVEVSVSVDDEELRSIAGDPGHLRLLREIGIDSYLAVPLLVRGEVLGVLSLVMSGSGRRLGQEAVSLAQELGRRAALAIDSARLYAAEQSARQRAEKASERSRRLQVVASALNQAATPEQVAEVCVRNGIETLGADAGSLALLNDSRDLFEIVSTAGFNPAIAEQWRRFPLAEGRPVSDSVLLRSPIIIGSREEWLRRYPYVLPDMEAAGTASLATIPLIVGDEPVAGLTFCFAGERDFDEADRQFLVTLGEQTAQALERARLFEAERAARSEAEVANRAKTEFLSAMSHELRTPLNAIAGYVDLLEAGVRGPLTDPQLADLARIKHAQSLLLGLITDILSFARIEAGRIEFHIEPLPVRGLLLGLEEIIGPQLAAKRIRYSCDPGPPDLAVMADPERIRQILINLLSNAVKFTEAEGAIEIRSAPEGDLVAIRVADTGRGIPADKLESIFDPFVQVRGITMQSQQGVGLGLAISRELAVAMGGDLTVQSSPGQGSDFSLLLPRAEEGKASA